jgi:hypothetical protein
VGNYSPTVLTRLDIDDSILSLNTPASLMVDVTVVALKLFIALISFVIIGGKDTG